MRKRAAWILTHSTGEILEAAPKRFVSGETLPYRGRTVRIVVESRAVRSPEVRFDHWSFRIAVPADCGTGSRLSSRSSDTAMDRSVRTLLA